MNEKKISKKVEVNVVKEEITKSKKIKKKNKKKYKFRNCFC